MFVQFVHVVTWHNSQLGRVTQWPFSYLVIIRDGQFRLARDSWIESKMLWAVIAAVNQVYHFGHENEEWYHSCSTNQHPCIQSSWNFATVDNTFSPKQLWDLGNLCYQLLGSSKISHLVWIPQLQGHLREWFCRARSSNGSLCMAGNLDVIHGTNHILGLDTFYPPQHTCMNSSCSWSRTGKLLKQVEQRRGVLYTFSRGVQPIRSVHLYCECRCIV